MAYELHAIQKCKVILFVRRLKRVWRSVLCISEILAAALPELKLMCECVCPQCH